MAKLRKASVVKARRSTAPHRYGLVVPRIVPTGNGVVKHRNVSEGNGTGGQDTD